MRVLMFGGEKGGTGKSTLAINVSTCLAYKKKDVVLLDTDPQGTATKWVTRRNEKIESGQQIPRIHCIQKTGNIKQAVIDLKSRYEYVVIDAGGNDSQALRTGMIAADILFVPIKASQADLETLPHVCQLIEAAKDFNTELKAYSVISMAPTNPIVNEAEEAKIFLKDFGEKIRIYGCIYKGTKDL